MNATYSRRSFGQRLLRSLLTRYIVRFFGPSCIVYEDELFQYRIRITSVEFIESLLSF